MDDPYEDDSLLTTQEMSVIEACSELTEKVRAIMPEDVGVVSLLEVTTHIFAIQRLVMSNAAARAYPKMYRLLGED